MEKDNRLFETEPGYVMKFGVTKVASGVQFAVYMPNVKELSLKLYNTGENRPAYIIPLSDEFRRGDVYLVTLKGRKNIQDDRDFAQILTEDYEYTYEADGVEFVDGFAHIIKGRDAWGKRKNAKRGLRGGISLDEFDWNGENRSHISYDDMIMYQLHVRGYTMHASSGVTCRGTYAGLTEKIPYIKELGVNALMLMPVYDFDEMSEAGKINYWGYGMGETYYFAPKTSYSSDKDRPDREFKQMIKKFHQNGIEVIMDIYFKPGTNLYLMISCLRNWVHEYHVDGFRVNQEVMPAIAMVSDPFLSGVKLLGNYWDAVMLSEVGNVCSEGMLAEYNEGFMNDARRFLKSDERMVGSFVNRFKKNPANGAVINFITHVNGFTLMDLVSYDVKHNESNGEMNKDGTEYNYSWNCGVEGKTKKVAVLRRRKKQIKNAFLMMLLSQGTPMIFAGDEFGNSQGGNNNAYCHDDSTTWLNWRFTKTGVEILDFVKKTIKFRKEHKILHMRNSLTMMDTKGCGMPDMSVHGVHAWRTDYSNYNRMLGILLCGKYAEISPKEYDDTIYIIFNMYWESREFELPNLPVGQKWYRVIDSSGSDFAELPAKRKKTKKQLEKEGFDVCRKEEVGPRTVAVFVGR